MRNVKVGTLIWRYTFNLQIYLQMYLQIFFEEPIQMLTESQVLVELIEIGYGSYGMGARV